MIVINYQVATKRIARLTEQKENFDIDFLLHLIRVDDDDGDATD